MQRSLDWVEHAKRALVGELDTVPHASTWLVDFVLVLLCGLLSTVIVTTAFDTAPDGNGALGIAIGWAAATTLLFRRRLPELSAAAALGALITTDDRVPLVFASYALAAYCRHLRWGWISALAASYLMTRDIPVVVYTADRDHTYFVLSAVLLPALFGATVRRHRAAMSALRHQARQANATVRQASGLAVLEERMRLAQQTLDSLGHRMTVLCIQASALQEDPQADDQLRQCATTIETTARAAMVDIRRGVDLIHDPMRRDPTLMGLDCARLITSVVRNMRATGMDLQAEICGDLDDLPPEYVPVLRRAGREALINAAKYARCSVVVLRLTVRPDQVALEIENSPAPGPQVLVDSAGVGLASLRTAAAKAGGRMQAHATDSGGFLLRVDFQALRRCGVQPDEVNSAGLGAD
ncbi:sensor histidine kinase [Streptomyces sp. N35]|uniref:sensor histidine kinase n=1 Tax=Streptomyces sp. N35 TaxID=2795730 RepID=UPI0018F6802D|nr:histidine kinase [Streptomyces sp. N35]